MANTISVNVVADVKNISRGIDNVNRQLGGFDKSIGKMGRGIKTMFGGAVALAGGNAIVGQIKSVVGGASDLNETISKTETIFGKSSPAIMTWGDNAAKSMGLSKQAALDGVSTFGNFFNQIGIGASQTEKMSKNFVQAAVDLGSFHNAAPVDVMEALSAATRGEYDSLQKYIPTINAAKVEQEALAATHKKSAKELTDQDKAMAVHSLVMKGQGKAAGDFARTQGSLANQTKIAKAEFDNMKTTVGTYLLPMFTKLAKWVTAEGIPMLKQFGGFFKSDILPVLQQVGGVLQSTVLPALMGFGKWIADNIPLVLTLTGVFTALFAVQKAHAAFMAVQAAGGLVKYIAQMNIVQAVTKTWTAVQWLLNSAFLANPITLVIIAIVALVAIIVIAWKKSETFRNIVIGAWNAIKAATSAVWGFIKNVLSTVWGWIKTAGMAYFNAYKTVILAVWNAIKVATSAVWNFIKGLVVGAAGAIKSAVTGALNTIKSLWSSVWNGAKSLITTVWNGIKSGISSGISGVISLISGLKNRVLGALRGAGSWLLETGRNVVQGLISGIRNMAGAVTRALLDLLPGPLKKFAAKLGIHSPSTVFKNFGKNIGQGLVIGLDSMGGKVTRAASDLSANVARGFQAPELSLSSGGLATGSRGGNTYQITVQAGIGNPVEIGREVKNAINAYERAGGR